MRTRNPWLPVLFFGSGIAALIYEVAWTRMLEPLMGTAVHAAATVLAAILLGMGLGSRLFGRLASRLRRPAVAFAFMEAGIGLYALLVPWLLGVAERVYVGWARADEIGVAGRSPLTFTVAFLILLIPTTLMGGTFPVLLRGFYPEHRGGGRTVSLLYAANTAGAAIGAFLAGFALLAFAGVRMAILTGFALHLLVAVAAFAIGWRAPLGGRGPRPASRRSGPLDARAGALLAASAIAGFCALGCEVLWTRSLVFLVGFSAYAFAAMLTTFILGFSLGGWIAASCIDRVRHRLAALGTLQLLVGAMILGSPWLLSRVRDVSGLFFGKAELVGIVDRTAFMFLSAGTVMLPATVAMGIAFPLFVHTYIETRRTDPSPTDAAGHGGDLLALNAVAGTLGALFTGFFLIGAVGIRGGILILGLLAAAAGAALLLGVSRAPWPRRVAAAAVPIGLLLAFLPGQVPGAPVVDPAAWGRGELASYEEDHTASVSVLRNGDLHTLTIHSTAIHAGLDIASPRIANDFVSGHLPMLLHPDPEDVMQIGIGTAVTLGSIAKHPVKRIAAVETCPAVPRAARLFDSANERVLDDPRLEVILNDGRNQLLIDPREYDVIVSDVWLSTISGISPLSTVEFYTLVRERLRPGGLFVPGPALLDRIYKVELRTLLEVFDHVYIFAFPSTGCYTTVATVRPLRVNLDRLEERFRDPALARHLEILELDEAADLLATYVCGTDCARGFAGPGPRDTDDLPVTMYDVPPMPAPVIDAPFDRGSAPEQVDALLALSGSPVDLLDRLPRDSGLVPRLQRYANANRTVIRARSVTDDPATRFALFQRALRIDDRNPAAVSFLAGLGRSATVLPEAATGGSDDGAPAIRLQRPVTTIPAADFGDRSGGTARGRGWTLSSNGYLRVDVDSPGDTTYRFKLRARGDLVGGQGPRVALVVDGRETAVWRIDSEGWSDLTLPLRLSAGRHALSLRYANDNDALSPDGEDRNLHVEHVVFESGSYTESAEAGREPGPG